MALEVDFNAKKGMPKHFSASAINTYLRCPTQWYFRYVEWVKSPPGVAMVKGSSVDAAATLNYTQKMDTHEDLPEADVLDATRDKFAEESDNVDWSQEEEKPAEAVDAAIAMARVWRAELAPIVQPTAVQRKITIDDPTWLRPVIGFIDTETEVDILDLKTSGKAKSQADLETDVQSGIYLLEADRRFSAQQFSWHVAIGTKTPKTQVLQRETFDAERQTRFVARVQQAIAVSVETGVFAPADPSTWGCSEKFCGYWHLCEWGGKK